MVMKSDSRKKGVFLDPGGAVLGRLLVAHVLAPGDDAHAEREPHPGRLGSQLAEPEHAQGLAVEAIGDAGLPATLAHQAVLGGDALGQSEDEGPGVLEGGVGQQRGAAYGHAPGLGRLHVDGEVAHAGRHQQAQLRQARDEGRRAWGCVRASSTRMSKPVEGLGGRVLALEGARRKTYDLRVSRDGRPIGAIESGVLIVVEYGDARALKWLPRNAASRKRSSIACPRISRTIGVIANSHTLCEILPSDSLEFTLSKVPCCIATKLLQPLFGILEIFR